MSDICPTPNPVQNLGLYWSSGSSGLCRFEKTEGADLARYSIEDKDVSAVIAKGTTAGTSVNFSSFSNHQYRCTVSLINSCGEGQVQIAESAVIIRPTPDSPIGTPTATLVPTIEVSPTVETSISPTKVAVSPSIKVSPTTTSILITSAPKGSGSVGTILALVGIVFLLLLIGGLIYFLKRKPGSASSKKVATGPVVNPSDAAGTYYVKPYKIEEDGKAMWLILSQGDTQILGLYSGSNVVEGYAVIKGMYEEADGVKFVEIDSLTPVPDKKTP